MSVNLVGAREVITPVAEARKVRAIIALGQTRYYRLVVAADQILHNQTQLAAQLGISQPAVSKALKTAESIPPVPAGFSGASPLEIAQAYAAGEIDRGDLIHQLTEWRYAQVPRTDGFDDLLDIPSGTFADVFTAVRQGYLDMATYGEIQQEIIASRDRQ